MSLKPNTLPSLIPTKQPASGTSDVAPSEARAQVNQPPRSPDIVEHHTPPTPGLVGTLTSVVTPTPQAPIDALPRELRQAISGELSAQDYITLSQTQQAFLQDSDDEI